MMLRQSKPAAFTFQVNKPEEWKAEVTTNRRYLRFIVALVIVCLAGVTVACVVAGLDFRSSAEITTFQSHLASGAIQPSPLAHYLDATDAPLNMSLENDLSNRVGKVYRIWARSAQPHVIRISAGGHNPTFDGTSKVATLGGAIGDGFMFEVTSRNTIAIVSVTNVVFS